jgi:hypothetical protein
MSYLDSPHPLLSFFPLSLCSWYSFSRSPFLQLQHVYTFFALYSPSYPLSLPPPFNCYQSPTLSPSRTCSILLLSDFAEDKRKKEKNKKWHFCLFVMKVATQGVSLWTLIGSSLFFSFYLNPFLMTVSANLRILYSFLYKEYINHIHLLSFLLLPYFSCMWLPLSVTSFS